MNNTDLSHSDIADWIASLLPPELWDRYRHLTYAKMAELPELADYAEALRKAERYWYETRKTSHR